MFPFINGLKKLLNVLHFKFVITFSNVFLLIFFGSLVDATFSNSKVDFFIIIGFINHSWISPTLQRGWVLELFILQKMGEGTFFQKKGQVGIIIEEHC